MGFFCLVLGFFTSQEFAFYLNMKRFIESMGVFFHLVELYAFECFRSLFLSVILEYVFVLGLVRERKSTFEFSFFLNIAAMLVTDSYQSPF